MTFENIVQDLKRPENKPTLICLILAAVGFILPLPYGFYTFLKIALFGVLIWLTLRGPGFNKEFLTKLQGLLLILMLLLYNPIFQIHLGSKFVWALFNVCTILLMLWLANNKKKAA